MWRADIRQWGYDKCGDQGCWSVIGNQLLQTRKMGKCQEGAGDSTETVFGRPPARGNNLPDSLLPAQELFSTEKREIQWPVRSGQP